MRKLNDYLLALACLSIISYMVYGAMTMNKRVPSFDPREINTYKHTEGAISYVVFRTGTGELQIRNYTLDSMEFVTQKKFFGLDK
jgi:hypothetical protein